jgi:hypothetical protein
VNYLAHFYIAEADVGPLPAACSLAPDLLAWSGATRPTHRLPAASPARRSPAWHAVRIGIDHHIKVDRWFHGCEWFDARMREAAVALKADGSPLREHWSLWLLRHITIELVLDGRLVSRDPGLTGRLYAQLAVLAGDAPAVATLEAVYGLPEAGFADYLTRFLQRRYLHLYADDGAVADILVRIFERLATHRPRLRELIDGRPVFSDDERAALPAFVAMVRDQITASPLALPGAFIEWRNQKAEPA